MLTPQFLTQMQRRQRAHDEHYHRDIVNLPPAAALKHMTLHQAKYLGRLAAPETSGDRQKLERLLVDAFVITLATANILHQRLVIADTTSALSLPEFIFAHAQLTGEMAKACEAWDHLEDYPFRRTLLQANQALFNLVTNQAQGAGIDLVKRYEARLREVEEKSIFDDVFKEAAQIKPTPPTGKNTRHRPSGP